MKNLKTRAGNVADKINHAIIALFAMFYASSSYAVLPPAVDPTSGASNGNFLLWLQGWWADAADMVGLVISTVLFLWAAWICFSKFNEQRSSKDPDWGPVGLTACVAAVLLVVCGYFLNQSTAVI